VADTTVALHLDGCLFPLPEEEALVTSLRQGDEEAYEMLIQRYHQPVYNLICRLSDDPSEAPDVVQEVFLKIFRNVGSFRGNSSLKTWIYRIAVNEAYNHQRWFSRHHRKEITLDSNGDAPSLADNLTDPSRSPFEQTADRETRILVEAALEKLNPKFRAAVVLRDIEGLSYEEIAAVLEVSLGTVKSRILRGREGLRKILEGQLEPQASVHWSAQLLAE
jgi:RNA polymerase sigma-70 factor (ECF subfamily)